MQLLHQPAQRLVPTEGRVDREVVHRVVTVVGRRGEDRGEVDGIDAEVGEVVDVVGDPGEVATQHAAAGRDRVPWHDVVGIERAIAVGETIREDLIDDGAGRPPRRLVGRQPVGGDGEPIEPLDGAGDPRRAEIDG